MSKLDDATQRLVDVLAGTATDKEAFVRHVMSCHVPFLEVLREIRQAVTNGDENALARVRDIIWQLDTKGALEGELTLPTSFVRDSATLQTLRDRGFLLGFGR